MIEVTYEEIMCVNPLSVASNKDMENDQCLKKVRFENVTDFMNTVKKGTHCTKKWSNVAETDSTNFKCS